MANHTPGPWIFDPENEGMDHHRGWGISADGMATVAHLPVRGCEGSEALAVSYANARLVAAAPEMLAALHEIAKGEGRFSRDHMEHACNTIEDMKALAVAAIIKAEGH
ncbi:MAG: hypothetical protein A2133_00825 [Actinobacteria bacterium RBG_16_64_13]|nr:MAG: hypothetical protein A2133_00825 [Actinobacteria bacterium RBG_16_64_13]